VASTIKVNAQLDAKAIAIPQINADPFYILNPIIVDVRFYTVLQSTLNLAVRVPALFSGLSKNGIGILNNFLNVLSRNFIVKFSATIDKKKFSND
jgi:hypothetical protein